MTEKGGQDEEQLVNKEVQAISKEVMPAMKRIKTGKVIGADGRYGEVQDRETFLGDCLTYERTPEEWRSLLISLRK